jgi:hypothetical protein
MQHVAHRCIYGPNLAKEPHVNQLSRRRIVGLSLVAAVATVAGLAQAGVPAFKCSSTKWKSVWLARDGKFKVANGLKTDEHSGYVGRTMVKPKGCAIEAKLGDEFLLVFDSKAKDALNDRDFELQCVDAIKPTGKTLQYGAQPVVSAAEPVEWTPPCAAAGLNAAEKAVCAKGDEQSDRADRFMELATKNKTFAIEVGIRDSLDQYYSEADGPSIKEVAPSGKVFCQYYKASDKTVLFTLTFTVPKQ